MRLSLRSPFTKNLEKELEMLEKEKTKLRKNLEYNIRKKKDARDPKDFSKYHVIIEFYDQELENIAYKIQDIKGKILVKKAEVKEAEYKMELAIFDESMLKLLESLKTNVEALKGNGQFSLGAAKDAYKSYTNSAVTMRIRPKDLEPYADLMRRVETNFSVLLEWIATADRAKLPAREGVRLSRLYPLCDLLIRRIDAVIANVKTRGDR